MKIEISLCAIKRNLDRLAAHTGKRLILMVKADAYGHGLIRVARAVPSPYYGVATEQEGIALRALGKEVLVTAPSPFGAELLKRYDMIPLIGEKAVAERAAALGLRRCHIKVNSGMNRLGFSGEKECYRMAKLLLEAGVSVQGIATHYKEDSPENLLSQNSAFDRAVQAIKKAAYEHGACEKIFTHVTGSGALRAKSYDCLRVGLAAYGYHAGYYTAGVPLEKAMRVTTEIIKVKSLPKGESLGYGGNYRASRPVMAYTVLGGYGDGIARSEVGRKVLAAGRRHSIAAVCMDSFEMVSDRVLPVGTKVTVLSEALDADAVAKHRNTIPYEVLLGYNVPRAERIYDE